MRSLTGISITFNTHGDNKNDSTIVHVFVKNRLGSSRTPEQYGDYISNRLDLSRYLSGGDLADGDQNPYLAFGEGLGAGTKFDDPSSTSFPLTPTSAAIDVDRIVLPAVSIHILTDSDDRWIFGYTLTFTVVDESGAQSTIERSSVRDGLRGVILDKNNRDHYGSSRRASGPRPRGTCRTPTPSSPKSPWISSRTAATTRTRTPTLGSTSTSSIGSTPPRRRTTRST
jgi:hypothetical protein